MKFHKYTRTFTPCPPSTKPLIIGWTASKEKDDLLKAGRAYELPGFWLYELQKKYSGKTGRVLGYLFGVFYANKRVKKKYRIKK